MLLIGGDEVIRSVSIICPYRDAAVFLPGLIYNVLQQTHPGWELLLINDASSDSGPEIAYEASCVDIRIQAFTPPPRPPEAPQGPWWPRNYGLLQAKYDLIAFLDVDDLWHPDKLRRQLCLHDEASVRVSVTGYARFDPLREVLLDWRLPPRQFGYSRLLRGNAIPMLTVMVERSLIQDGFQACPHEDYLLWLTVFCSQRHLQCHTLPDLLGFYAVHEGNLTGKRWQMPFWTYQVFRKHGMGILKATLFLALWGLNHLLGRLHVRDHLSQMPLSSALRVRTPWPLIPTISRD